MLNTEFGFRDKIRSFDFLLLFAALALSALGIVCIAEAAGERRIFVQSMAVLAGVCAMFLLSMVNYEIFVGKIAIAFFAGSVLLLILTLRVGIGDGNTSWIDLGPFTVQPSEFVKVAFLITLSAHINKVKDSINDIRTVLLLLLHGGIIIGLVVLQKDLGSALIYLFVFVMMLFAAGISIWYLLGGLAVLIAGAPFLWNLLADYQQKRILVGFNPDLDPLDKGFQAVKSREAIASGGLFGVGPGNTVLSKNVPKAYNDMIFCVLGELFGFFGILIFFLLTGLMIFRLLRLAKRARKDSGSYICVGAAAILIAQTLENVGMCLGMLPVIGITLPFMSSGGSSALSLWLTVGLAVSISTHSRKYYFERESS